jgi:CRISPR type IV-associated protein Csf3
MRDILRREDFTPMRVRAYLQTGVISDQFLPLDGIMYYHQVRNEIGEEYGAKVISMPGESNVREGKNITLPILKSGPAGDAWFYACSVAQWPVATVEDNTFYVKRFDLNFVDYLDTTKKGKVELAKGRYKNYHIDVYYRHAVYIEWYCVGVKDKIENILQFCTHLGKKTGQGWGSVLKWEVIDWPEDWSIRGPGNRLMRPVPVRENGFEYGLRPSYWNPRHIFPCKMPD